MQSFLQHRRIGRQVKQQLDRHREKYDTLRKINDEHATIPTAQVTQNRSASEVDVERGEGEKAPRGSPSTQEDVEKEEKEANDQDHTSPTSTSLQEEPTEPLHDAAPAHLGISLSRTTTRSGKGVGTRLGHALSGINARDRTTAEGGDGSRQVFVVNFESDRDATNPHNWSWARRMVATMVVAAIGAVVGVASSIDSSVLRPASAAFGVSEVVESLATGIYLIGFGFGALFAGPISETVGRNPVYIVTLALYMIWIMASALAPNIGSQLVFRFFAGFFGSSPLTCAGGSVADLWDPLERVYTFPIFANAAFMGPVLGPVIGGWISISPLVSWRWTEWITLIISGLVLGSVVLLQPETYSPVLLKWKAQQLRKLTGDERFAAPIEVREESFVYRLRVALYRPFLLTFQEPIIVLIALYLTVVYIILFTFLDGYDYIFGEIHGTSEGITGTCFLGIALGLCVSSALVPLIYRWAKRDLQKIKDEGGERLPPEFRLWFSMLGGAPAIPISLFWMGWTSDSNISLWSPLAASVLFGYGILSVFISSYQYIIDSYEIYAASGLASVTLLRYLAAGGMVVVGVPFYENLGVHYTLTILGCISAVLVPVPYIFYKYGHLIRARSKYTVSGGSSKPG